MIYKITKYNLNKSYIYVIISVEFLNEVCFMESLTYLQSVLDSLTGESDIHICILSLSGIMSNKIMQLKTQNLTHVRIFCHAAKSTPKGATLCLACKALTIQKCHKSTEPYFGTCPFGLTEYVTPVYFDKNLICIIYVGHINAEDTKFKNTITRIAKRTNVDEYRLLLARPKQATKAQIARWSEIGEILKSYILMLCHYYKLQNKSDMHWCVRSINNYINENYATSLSLKRLAKLFFFNENYLGRLYKKEMGISFSDYVTQVRLEHACNMLKNTEKTIIEISCESGFNNVTYFNRVFKTEFGKTPTAYKAEISKE